jgi:hypothetical protein
LGEIYKSYIAINGSLYLVVVADPGECFPFDGGDDDESDPPITDPPITDPPITDPPITDPPITDPPITDPPITDPPTTNPPDSGGGGTGGGGTGGGGTGGGGTGEGGTGEGGTGGGGTGEGGGGGGTGEEGEEDEWEEIGTPLEYVPPEAPDVPPDPEDEPEDEGEEEVWGGEPELPERLEKPDSVVIPERIKQQYGALFDKLQEKLGVNKLKELIKLSGGSLGKFCIENPIKELNGYKLPDFKECINFDELAEEEYMKLLRAVLLFMVVMLFVSSIFVVLRQY